jgi:hypothetical protein
MVALDRSVRRRAAIAAVGVLLVLCFNPYNGFSQDVYQYLLPAFKNAVPDFAKNDWFVYRTTSYHFVYEWLTTWLLRRGLLEAGLFGLHVAAAALLAWGVVRFGEQLAGEPRWRTLWVLVIVFIGIENGWAGYIVYVHIAVPSAFMTPLGLLAVGAALEGSLAAAAFWIAAAIAVHFSGGLALAAALLPMLCERARGRVTRRALAATLVCALLLVPLFARVLGSELSPADPRLNDLFFYGRTPHHYAIDKQGWRHLQSCFLLLAHLGAILVSPRKSLRRPLLIFFATCVLLFLGGVFFLKVVYWPSAVKLLPYRLIPLLATLTAALLVDAIEDARSGWTALGWLIAIAVYPLSAAAGWIALAGGAALLWRAPAQPLARRIALVASASVAAAFAAWRVYELNPGLAHYHLSPTPESAALKNFTRPGDIILVPPALLDVRLKSGRAIVVDYKAAPIYPSEIKEWAERMKAITGVDPADAKAAHELVTMDVYQSGFEQQSRAALLEAARRYGAGYVLATRSSRYVRESSEPPVWSDDSYALFRVAGP